MATYYHVNANRSPRLVTLLQPSTEATLQDVSDKVKDWEDEPASLSYARVIRTSGKEDLGGGVSVGITAQFENALLAFQSQTASKSEGTVTTADSHGKTLIDSTANFETDGVTEGALVVNFTDRSVATVLSVDSQTQLTHEALADGTDDQWEIGDAYKVWNVVQCSVSGGNLTAVDSGGSSMEPIFPTAFTQVIRTSASSATLQELEAVQYASYQNAIWIDTANGSSGTAYPMGTREYPVDNLTDAVVIASDRGFKVLQILETMTLDSGTDISEFTIIGESTTGTEITIDVAAQCADITIRNCTVDGTLDGGTTIEHCIVKDMTYVNGIIRDSLMQGTIVLGGAEMARVINCHSDVPGVTTPTVDCGGSGQSLSVRNYNGGIKLINKTGSDNVSIDMNSGQIHLDSTVTGGTIVCRGIGKLVDNSNGATVVDEMLTREAITEVAWDTVHIDTVNGNSGTDFPRGTASDPVDNMADAKTIADARLITRFRVSGSVTLPAVLSGYIVEGASTALATIDLDGNTVTDSQFKTISIIGNGVGRFDADGCLLAAGMTNITANLENCILEGTFTIAAGEFIYGDRCKTETGITVNLNGDGTFGMGNCAGQFTIINATDPSAYVGISGYYALILMSSCVAGTAGASGIGRLIDMSAGMTVTDSTIPGAVWDQAESDHTTAGSFGAAVSLIRDVGEGRWEIDAANSQMVYYKPDNVTELFRVDLKDSAGAALDCTHVLVHDRVRV